MDEQRILGGLNPEQRLAAEAVRGPVCILAGAGSGKTTTITHRIANQVATGAFLSEQILAVTFTDKAAGEMRSRLAALGVERVRAATFHSAALAQLSYFGKVPNLKILSSKVLPLRAIGNSLPMPYKFTAAADLATEVEWAKNRRLTPETYLDGLGEHESPIPPELMQRVFRDYERRKEERGSVDFEDLLAGAVGLFERDADALGVVQARYRAFTVDEYQDVNLLQQTLLELWLGERDDLCAVGDDYQAIYAFTGATPRHLLELPDRYPHATVVRLEANYRSTPEVLALANRLVPKLGGAPKTLRAARESGPEPVARPFATLADELDFVVERVRALHADGVPYDGMAVLYRLNARSADFEAAFAEAKIPFQGAALLERDAARQLLKALRGREELPALEEVRRVALDHGLHGSAAAADRRAGGDAAEGPEAARVAGAGRGNCRRVRRGPARALLERLGRRRAPAHVPPREGARVRRGVPAAARLEASCPRSARRPTTRSRKSGGCSTSGSRVRDGS